MTRERVISSLSRGFFITLEGPEGCGKSTQSYLLTEYLRSKGRKVVLTREPGGTRIGDLVRRIILDPENRELCFRAEALLYAADRAQHVEEKIRPSLQAGMDVVCDRFVDSSIVYQGVAGGVGVEDVKALNLFATGGLEPSLTILLDCPPEVGLSRKGRGMGDFDRIEQRDIEYHLEVRNAYLSLAADEPRRFVVVDSSGLTKDRVQDAIRKAISERLTI